MAWRFELLNKPYGGITEGPVWDGEAVYFTHISNHRIMRYDPVSGAITQSWHPPDSVTAETPERTDQFMADVLAGRRLL